MKPEQLAAARALVDAASAGPWRLEIDRNAQQNVHAGDEWIAIVPHQCVASIEQQREKDAAFIAGSRTLVPALLDEVDRLRATLEWLDRGGGLGHDVHRRIRATLGKEFP